MTQSVRCLITFRNGWKASGVWSGLPVSGLRACRWTIAAPASAAPMAASAISSGVTGRCGDMLGVWMAPVTAQVMMTLFDFATVFPPVSLNFEYQSVSTLAQTLSDWPETLRPAGDARNNTMAATSSALTIRRSEVLARYSFSISS